MLSAYCYLPILPARGGAFRAVGALSPLARSRLIPLFDVPLPVLRGDETLEAHLGKRAIGIHQCWGPGRPVYVDVHDLPLDLYTSSGTAPIAYLVEALRMRGSHPIPVTGTQEERGEDYIRSIRTLASEGRDGVCLRLDRDTLVDSVRLKSSVTMLLDALGCTPEDADVVLDFGYIGNEIADRLRATAIESLQLLDAVGRFRNTSVSGTSIPEQLGKHGHGKVLRHTRTELQLWTKMTALLAGSFPLAFSDYGIVGAHYVPPNKHVQTPARIRYTTHAEHIFRRAKPNEHSQISRDLISSEDYLGPTFSSGDQLYERSATNRTGPGNAALWVAYDTNHHLELASDQVWGLAMQHGTARLFVLPEARPQPWLQTEILSH